MHDCLSRILLTGGNTDLSGFALRLRKDLREILPEHSAIVEVRSCPGTHSWNVAMGSTYVSLAVHPGEFSPRVHKSTPSIAKKKVHIYCVLFAKVIRCYTKIISAFFFVNISLITRHVFFTQIKRRPSTWKEIHSGCRERSTCCSAASLSNSSDVSFRCYLRKREHSVDCILEPSSNACNAKRKEERLLRK